MARCSDPVPRQTAGGYLPGPTAYLLNRALAPLAPLSAAYAFARPWGDFAYATWADKRRTVHRNYARILGRSEDDPLVASLARRCFRQFALYIAEMIHVQGWETEGVTDRLTVQGAEHFAEAESAGRGIIFTSAHMGSTEVAASLVVLRNYRVTSVMEDVYPQFVMEWIKACRERTGISLLPSTGSGIRLLRALRRGGMVALVVDAGVQGVDGVCVQFLGKHTMFPAGPARLARLSGAPIVFGVAVRRPGGSFLAHIEPPVFADRSLDADADAQQITQQIARIFETYVRRYPDQWYVFRDLWPEERAD